MHTYLCATGPGFSLADIKAEWVGVVWGGVCDHNNRVLSHIKVKLTVKVEWAALPKGPGENTKEVFLRALGTFTSGWIRD